MIVLALPDSYGLIFLAGSWTSGLLATYSSNSVVKIEFDWYSSTAVQKNVIYVTSNFTTIGMLNTDLTFLIVADN